MENNARKTIVTYLTGCISVRWSNADAIHVQEHKIGVDDHGQESMYLLVSVSGAKERKK